MTANISLLVAGGARTLRPLLGVPRDVLPSDPAPWDPTQKGNTKLGTMFQNFVSIGLYAIILAAGACALFYCFGILKAHKDGGQASFMGLGMCALAIVVSGSILSIMNFVAG